MTLTGRVFVCLLAMVVPALAATMNPAAQIATEAKTAAATASEMEAWLKNKNNKDFAALEAKMEQLRKSTGEIHTLASGLNSTSPNIDRVKQLAELLNVFVENKKNHLTGDEKNRSYLRAMAKGIAERAEKLRIAAEGL